MITQKELSWLETLLYKISGVKLGIFRDRGLIHEEGHTNFFQRGYSLEKYFSELGTVKIS